MWHDSGHSIVAAYAPISKGSIAVSKVVAIMSMSLDGYVADRSDGVTEVFDHLRP